MASAAVRTSTCLPMAGELRNEAAHACTDRFDREKQQQGVG